MSWDYFYELSKLVAQKMIRSGYLPDIVIGVARGGWVFARMLCDFQGIKDLLSLKVEHWGITASPDGEAKLKFPLTVDLSNKRCLIVDDITDTGKSMIKAAEHIKKLNPLYIRTATLMPSLPPFNSCSSLNGSFKFLSISFDKAFKGLI